MVVVKNYLGFFKLQGFNCLSPQLVRVPRTLANSYQPITFEEYVLMLGVITIDSFWNLQKVVILRLLFETGMRVSEVCDLNVTDIDPAKMNTTIKTKKSARMRSIFWSVESHIYLKEFLVERKKINSTPALFVAQSKTESATKRMTTRTV